MDDRIVAADSNNPIISKNALNMRRFTSMNQYYPRLFSPLQIKKTTFRNRIWATPNCCFGENSGNVAFFENKAKGGAAVVTMSESAVSPQYEVQDPGFGMSLAHKNDYVKARMGDITIAVKAFGAVPSIQLSHHGMFARPDKNGGVNPIGPVGLIRERDGVEVLPMDEDMIEQTIEDFAQAAAFAKRCGFEMIQLHGGHGWLLAQFLSAHYNSRTDRWGGTLENRARFPIAVAERIRQYCGRDFLIEYRISGDELVEGGMRIDEVCRFAEMMQDYVDIFNVSAGVHDDRHTVKRMMPMIGFAEPGCNVYLAAEVKKHVKIPVLAVGGITSPAQAEQILAEGKADIIGMGRELICDPEFANKARHGQTEEIIPCMRCNACIADLAFDPLPYGQNKQFGCAANPKIARDLMIARIQPPKASRRVVVIGGGPAGMTAAITAAERGHRVTLLEKSGALGGYLKVMDCEPRKQEVVQYKDYLARRTCKLCEVRLNTEATAEVVKTFSPDAVICAVGANIFIPPIPGLGDEKPLTFMDAYYSPEKIGRQVVLVGGGIVGCETAVFLSEADPSRKITIVEMRNVLADPNYVHHYTSMMDELDKNPNITYYVGTKCVKASEGSITVSRDGAEQVLPADSIVFCAGLTPDKKTVEALRDTALDFYTVGDCVSAKRIKDATRAAYFAAMNIL